MNQKHKGFNVTKYLKPSNDNKYSLLIILYHYLETSAKSEVETSLENFLILP